MLTSGIVRESKSPYASQVILARKKDGTMRFCIDFRKLNALTIKDKYPLPNIQSAIDAVSGSTIFSLIDLNSGFW